MSLFVVFMKVCQQGFFLYYNLEINNYLFFIFLEENVNFEIFIKVKWVDFLK